MVVKTPRRARPLLALAALLFMGLVVLPTASRADFEPANYAPVTFNGGSQNSTLQDAAIAAGVGGVLWLIFRGAAAA